MKTCVTSIHVGYTYPCCVSGAPSPGGSNDFHVVGSWASESGFLIQISIWALSSGASPISNDWNIAPIKKGRVFNGSLLFNEYGAHSFAHSL